MIDSFSPHKGEKTYSRGEVQIDLFQKTLGRIPKEIALSGTKSEKLFDSNGELKNIPGPLITCGLYNILTEKYKWTEQEAREFTEFLSPMLHYDKNLRANATDCLKHPWLTSPNDSKTVVESMSVDSICSVDTKNT